MILLGPNVQRRARVAAAITAVLLGACGGNETVGPSTHSPAALDAVSALSPSAQVGAAVTGGIVVKVTDASGHAVPGASVAFAVTAGNGATTPRIAISDAQGQATAVWTLGTIAGKNTVMATVATVSTPIEFDATGIPGPAASIAVSPPSARLVAPVASVQFTARSLDSFGNATTPGPSFTVRDPTLISVDSSGLVRTLRRGASTYVVVSSGSLNDSVQVTVLDVGQSVCTGAANPMELAVGQVITGVSGAGACIHASSDNTEYALVPYYDNSAPAATIQLEVRGQGLGILPLPASPMLSAVRRAPPVTPLRPDESFEARLRARERGHMAPMLAGARSWFRARRNADLAATTTVVPTVGQLVTLNVNANDFCANADYRVGRVAVITNKAIIVTDTANPPGGFTDAEFQSIGVTFDTLVDPVDRAAFGSPSDIDNNGHVIMFFTRAVNELTAANSSTVVLGFFYQRDLLPTGGATACAGSNAGEMFYLLVPDTGGVINGNKRSKAQVVTFTNGTVAHEYQHLINASRRMYVNGVGENFEEKWLDEGLAHSAEELNLYQAAGRVPRQNLDASALSDPKFAAAYATFGVNNIRRYEVYLGGTEGQAPIGADPNDDDLATRGAIWSFLRFAADHQPAGTENSFWFRLVNSTTSGVANLTNVLGTSPDSLMRDWAISVFLDDNAANVDPRFQQSSWNFRDLISNDGTSTVFPLAPRMLRDGGTQSFQMWAHGVSFLRFTVPTAQDALLTVTSGGLTLPANVQLAIVRVH